MIDHDYRLRELERQTSEIKAKVSALDAIVASQSQLISRIAWGLMVLVGVLAGKEGILSALRGGSPVTDYLFFAMICFIYATLTGYLLFQAIIHTSSFVIVLAAGTMLLAAYLRIALGIDSPLTPVDLIISIIVLITGTLALGRQIYQWHIQSS